MVGKSKEKEKENRVTALAATISKKEIKKKDRAEKKEKQEQGEGTDNMEETAQGASPRASSSDASSSSGTVEMEDPSEVLSKTCSHYETKFTKDMRDLMVAAQKVEKQLISNAQKEAILTSVTQLANHYKKIKHILIKGATGVDVTDEDISSMLGSYDSKCTDLISIIQGTSISSTSFQEFVPFVMVLRKDINHLKNFVVSNSETQQQQFKLMEKTQQFEKKEKSSVKEEAPGRVRKSLSLTPDSMALTVQDNLAKGYSTVGFKEAQMIAKSKRKDSFLTLSRKGRKSVGSPVSPVVRPTRAHTSLEVPDLPDLQAAPTPRPKYANLFEAAQHGDVEEAKLLRKKGLGVNGIDSDGKSALHHAVLSGHMDMCIYLVGDGIQLDIQDRQGMTALDRACLNGEEVIALYLAARGASFDMLSKNGMTVMDRSNMSKSFWEKLLGNKLPSASEQPEIRPTLPRIDIEDEKIPSPVKPAPTQKNPDTRPSSEKPKPRVTVQKDTYSQQSNPDFLLHHNLTEFLASHLSLTSIIIAPHFGREELSHLSEPLQDITLKLKSLLATLKGTGDLGRPLTECVVYFVRAAKELSESPEDTPYIKPLINACKSIVEAAWSVLLSLWPAVDIDEGVLPLVQNYLLSIKNIIQEVEPQKVEAVSRTVVHAMAKLVLSILSFDPDEMDIVMRRDVVVYCSALEVNTKRIASEKSTGKEVNGDVTKTAMENVRKLMATLKSADVAPAALSTHGYNDAIRRLGHIKTSKAGANLPAQLSGLLEAVDIQIEELKKIEKNFHTPTALLNSTRFICDSLFTMATTMQQCLKRAKWTAEVIDIWRSCIQCLYRYSFKIQLFSLGQVSDFKLNQRDILDLSELRNTLGAMSVVVEVIFAVIESLRDQFQDEKMVPDPQEEVSKTFEEITKLMTSPDTTERSQKRKTLAMSTKRNSIALPPIAEFDPMLVLKVRQELSLSCLKVRAVAAAKLFGFLESEGQWKETGADGILSLSHHEESNDFFFHITNPNTMETQYSFNIPRDLQYHKSSYYFHRFPSTGGFTAFSFYSTEAAEVFLNAVMQVLASM